MDLIFVLVTQLINLTSFNIDFEVGHGRRLLPELGPGKTRFAKQSRVLRRLRHHGPDWKIRVMIDGKFSGIELHPQLILDYVRLIFRVDGDEGNVDGVLENSGNDFLLRHRYFGCMRNFYWNSRPLDESIYRSDSKWATKLRARDDPRSLNRPMDSEKQVRPRDEHRPPLTGEIGIKSPPNGTATAQQARPRDEESLTNVVDKDGFVHGLMIVFSFVVCILLKFLI